ncbi:MAG TPA: site-2 protease family protein [Gemmataceae bacterium]|nr:site-2 protease family protein [Gemmataceae bacterium]
MRDVLAWSMPLGRMFGITIRVHVLFPFVAVGMILRTALQKDAPPDIWIPAAVVIGLLFLAVLLHEFGHCFAARLVDGDAQEILIWPLGGLAFVDVPHTPRANFLTAAAGPFVNLVLCLITGIALVSLAVRPPLNPWWVPIQYNPSIPGHSIVVPPELYTWEGGPLVDPNPWVVLLARFFWLNWILMLLNVLLPGFPLDGGRMLQAALWPRLGFRQAMQVAIMAGFVVALVIGVYSVAKWDPLFLCLGLFVYSTCRQQYIILETGGDESMFGYDFSQGYTSLERDQPRLRRRQPNVWQRWRQRRAQRRLQRELEQREFEERRMDELLEKVQREGLQALSDEERRFLTRVSAKYRNRQ